LLPPRPKEEPEAVPLRVLIVEDSEDDAVLLLRVLRRGGYLPDSRRVDCAAGMRAALDGSDWDVVLSDHNLPTFNSTEALLELSRCTVDVPFIIVSGSIGEETAVAAMRAGAHDYIMKDNLARLVPAIRRELRESEVRKARVRLERDIHYMASHDVLTGLANRGDFDRALQGAIEDAERTGNRHAVLNLDLDQFKVVNDTCGHLAGDELLKQLAKIIQKRLSPGDSLARLGGDEYGLLLRNHSLEQARGFAEVLMADVNGFRFSWQNATFGVSASIGLLEVGETAKTPEQILGALDLACHAAKDLGGNRVYAYTEEDLGLSRRHSEMRWVSRIDEALEKDQFALYWQVIQPLAAEASGLHAEFLIRLHDGHGGLIPPAEFIPAAERYKRMPKVDRWVICHAFAYLSRLFPENRRAEAEGMFSINLSGTSLSDPGLFDFIWQQLTHYRLPAGVICFEITETAAIEDFGNAITFVERARREGFLIALDDFGVGMCSFSYLKALPVDILKIDGGFVQTMLQDPMNCAIVEAINDIGHKAGLKTVAEFVETEAVARRLLAMGVDYAQGFGIAKPVPVPEQAAQACQ